MVTQDSGKSGPDKLRNIIQRFSQNGETRVSSLPGMGRAARPDPLSSLSFSRIICIIVGMCRRESRRDRVTLLLLPPMRPVLPLLLQLPDIVQQDNQLSRPADATARPACPCLEHARCPRRLRPHNLIKRLPYQPDMVFVGFQPITALLPVCRILPA